MIPTLEEVISTFQKTPLHIEIKSEAVGDQVKGGVEELVLELVDRFGIESTCVISSFSSIPLFRIRDMNSKIAIAATFDHSLNDADKHMIEQLRPFAIHLPINKIRNSDVDYASVNDLRINVYTVNSPVQMKSAQDLLRGWNFYKW
ncbi:MAG: glycerophosphodiester phosphodiesterase [Bdellovibrionota bacterium]